MKKSKALWRIALLLAMIGVAVAGWRYVSPSQTAVARPVRSDAVSDARGGALADAADETRADAGPSERRLDLAALRKSLAGRDDAQVQLQRIVAFARFRDRIAAYGEGRNSMPAAERARLARQILAELPEHVARNEIVPVQAEALSAALLADATADSDTRGAAIQSMRQQWDAYARQTVGPSPASDPRYLAYARQSRDIVRQVQASGTDADQQQAVIAQRLQALRVQLFDQTSRSDTR
ncbi:phospholipase C accessory protein PlcR [Burkholderia thailandensis 34]|uniref:phospholipase C accessory protein PlcR n=1 Tax=Burkholderia thailandensis TaxID=57975 RepID=UPI0005D87EB4|nr:phospholipase C accessory protein PlcR [Burkholderia thailandensis]AJY30590.1 phospholipase C accessory protein PlcR [Burkholderia thailandensis 34]AOJ56257.1 phospholipase C accessory protein PlcR [Burkholderia thailandensis]KXF61998.1 phospholipase C accessory protein PlcR [Burkholderia thailandensis]PNE76221.1 phospholipase C accessory protein PlcR [Burkholderia thailandensis]